LRDFKLISILRTFSREEMKKFGLFITSPYFNRTRNYDRIYQLLKKYHPKFPPDKLTTEKIFTYLYPGEIFNKSKSTLNIRVLFSQLTNLAEKFTAYERFEQDRYNYVFNDSIAESFENRRLFKLALRKQLMNSAELDADEKSEDYYNRRFKTNQALGDLCVIQYKPSDQFKHEKNNLLYLYAYIFSNFANHLNRASVKRFKRNVSVKGFELAKSFVDAFDPELFDRECEDDAFSTKNITIFYYFIIKAILDETDNKSSIKALEYFYKLFPYVSHRFKFDCYICLHNRLYPRLSLDKIYAVKLNELYDVVLGKGVFSRDKNGYLDPVGYAIALKIKLYLLSISEVRKFIDTYSEKVAPEFREDIRNFSLAELCFKEKLYGKCLEYNSKKDNLGTSLHIEKHKLTMCSLFEEGSYVEAIYAADSFEHFLRRNRNKSEPRTRIQLDFLRAFRYISRFENNRVNFPDKSLERVLETHTYSVFYDWLNEKLMKHQNLKSIKPA
jgi:hypothetical protein